MSHITTLRTMRDLMSPRQISYLHLAVIALCGALVYSNTFHVLFVLDDVSILVFGKNSLIDILLHGGSRRVADLTFALNYKTHGLHVAGYHAVNLAIHLSAAITFYFFIVAAIAALRLQYHPDTTGMEEPGFIDRFVPLAAALLFVSHPLQTQAVTYIIQRYTSLATLLYLLSALLFVRWRTACDRNGSSGYLWLMGGLSMTSGLLAMGCKQIAFTLPLMLAVLEIVLFKGRLLNRRLLTTLVSLIIVALAAMLLVWSTGSPEDLLDKLHHATADDLKISRLTYFLTETRVVVTYLRLLVLPFGQSLMHDYPLYTTLFSLPVIASLALHMTLLAAAVTLFSASRSSSTSRDRECLLLLRLSSLGIFWFYIALSVESSFIPIRDVIFEHRVYLPSAGFFLAIVSAGAALATRGNRAGIKTAWLLLIAACLVLGSMTFTRNHLWRDRLALWEDVVRKYPDKPLALPSLAGEYVLKKMPEKAIPLYVRALELEADFYSFLLGEALQEFKMFESRFTSGKEFMHPDPRTGAMVLDESNRTLYESAVFNTLALAYEYIGDTGKALEYYEKSLWKNPRNDLAWYNLGLLAFLLGDREEAARVVSQLKGLNPRLSERLAAVMGR